MGSAASVKSRWPGGSSPAGLLLGSPRQRHHAVRVPALASEEGAGLADRLGRVWMRAHIWLGFLTVPLIVLHSGFSLGGQLSSLLMILFGIVIVSGIFGLVLQQFLPRLMLERVPAETIYSQIDYVAEQSYWNAEDLIEATCGAAGRRSTVVAAAAAEGRIGPGLCHRGRGADRRQRSRQGPPDPGPGRPPRSTRAISSCDSFLKTVGPVLARRPQVWLALAIANCGRGLFSASPRCCATDLEPLRAAAESPTRWKAFASSGGNSICRPACTAGCMAGCAYTFPCRWPSYRPDVRSYRRCPEVLVVAAMMPPVTGQAARSRHAAGLLQDAQSLGAPQVQSQRSWRCVVAAAAWWTAGFCWAGRMPPSTLREVWRASIIRGNRSARPAMRISIRSATTPWGLAGKAARPPPTRNARHVTGAPRTIPVKPGIEAPGCSSCHQDHQGLQASLLRMDNAACTRCHQAIERHIDGKPASLSDLVNVTHFDEEHHPEFSSAQEGSRPPEVLALSPLDAGLGQ